MESQSFMKTNFTEILNELSYRVSSGIPDLTNEQHLMKLWEILKEHNWNIDARVELLKNLQEKVGKVYIQKGKGPSGVKLQVGPRGGKYYMGNPKTGEPAPQAKVDEPEVSTKQTNTAKAYLSKLDIEIPKDMTDKQIVSATKSEFERRNFLSDTVDLMIEELKQTKTGAGAREMTKDLIAQRATAEALGIKESRDVRILLSTKGVNFGFLTARPNGTIDTSEIEGVDRDLIIKPFTQKGVVISLRVFTNNAMNHHHGMQSSERFLDKEDVHKAMDVLSDMNDYDGDGVENELSSGDITAVTLFQATLKIPVRILPESEEEKKAVKNGDALFKDIGCNSCHVESLPLKSLNFTDPSPFNPKNHLSPDDTAGISVDLGKFFPNLERDSDGNYLVPLFSDLRRHSMGGNLNNEKVKQLSSRGKIDTDQWMTKKLWGFASEPPFLHHGRATLISEAILMHGGDAEESRVKYQQLSAYDKASIVEYLNTFQIPKEE